MSKIEKYKNSVSSNLSFSMRELAKQCVKGDYVLVIGSEIILDRTQWSDYNGNSSRMLSEFAKSLYNDESPLRGICLTLKEINAKGDLASDNLNPVLRKLLSHKCFKTIITTAYDPFLELYLKELWGRPIKILNINSKDKDAPSDISSSEISLDEFNRSTPILYYAFGRAQYENLYDNTPISEFAATDNDKLKIVSQWLGNQSPINFLHYIRKKRILAIGCDFDDWLFRFFWYMLHQDVSMLKNGEVVFDYVDRTDISLRDYLKSQSIRVFDDAQSFIGKLSYEIDSLKKCAKADLLQGIDDKLRTISDNGIFISYAHEDFWVAKHIYDELKKRGLNVWMDPRLEAGDIFDDRIISAINHCQIFMPLLSTTVKVLLENEECKKRYFYKEWTIADERCIAYKNVSHEGGEEMIVFPVLLNSFDIGKNYNNMMKSCIQSRHAHSFLSSNMDSLIAKIVNLTNKKIYD